MQSHLLTNLSQNNLFSQPKRRKKEKRDKNLRIWKLITKTKQEQTVHLVTIYGLEAIGYLFSGSISIWDSYVITIQKLIYTELMQVVVHFLPLLNRLY